MTPTFFDQDLRREMIALSTHTFTLTFLGGQIAVLQVRGTMSQELARDLAEKALPLCRYNVVDGDQTHGYADYFYLWSSSAAQERREGI